MSKTVVGVFHNEDAVNRACDELFDNGIARRDVKIFGEMGRGLGPTRAEGVTGSNRDQRIHQLKDAGIHESDAAHYADQVESGATVVAVLCKDEDLQKCRGILEKHVHLGGREAGRREDISAAGTPTRASSPGTFSGGREEGLSAEEASIKPQPVGFMALEEKCRQHFDRNLADRGSWRDLRPAYELGYDLAGEPGCQGQPFAQCQDQAERRWNLMDRGVDWNVAMEACRFGYELPRPEERPHAGGPA